MIKDKGSFKKLILSILEKFPAGISEFHLMQELKGKSAYIPADFGRNNLALFQSHFHLFNALYELQLELPESRRQALEISALKIQLRPVSLEKREKSLTGNSDSGLRNYYLDLSNLEQTTSEDVEDMLNHFWKTYLSRDKKIEALKVLGLEADVAFDDIRKQYRKLAKELHPDRGGDKEKLQELNEAMEILRQTKNH